MARHTAKSHKIRKVEILVIQIKNLIKEYEKEYIEFMEIEKLPQYKIDFFEINKLLNQLRNCINQQTNQSTNQSPINSDKL